VLGNAVDASLQDALALLESHVNSPQGHAAIKTLRSELNVTGPATKPSKPSPGQQAAQRNTPGSSFGANAGKLAAFARMKAAKK
jgi:hypothetical protein